MKLNTLINPNEQQLEELCRSEDMRIPSTDRREEIEDTSRFQSLHGNHSFIFDMPYSLSADVVPSGKIVAVMQGDRFIIFSDFESPGVKKIFARLKDADSASNLFGMLVALMIDRIADGIEISMARTKSFSNDLLSGTMKSSPSERANEYQKLVFGLAKLIENGAIYKQSLLTIRRGILFAQEFDLGLTEKNVTKNIFRDIDSLNEQCTFLTARLNYLQDSVFGMLSVEQNQIIKIFSIAAVIFLPPTMFASIWGMNFDFMPELNKVWGYPFAIAVMTLSGIIPWRIFKHRGWM